MTDDRHWAVSWEVDAFQPTAHEAAEWVRETMLPFDTTATVFIVTDPVTGARWQIDLGDGTQTLVTPGTMVPAEAQPIPGWVRVTRAEGRGPCGMLHCGRSDAFVLDNSRHEKRACSEHLASAVDALLPSAGPTVVEPYAGSDLCVVGNGHDGARAEYRAGDWLVCYRHLGRGAAAAVRGYGRP